LWHWGDNGALFRDGGAENKGGRSDVHQQHKGTKPLIDEAMDAESLAFDWLK
jgi:hypothetical protein